MEPPDFRKRMTDFNRLLEGEDRDSADPEDARHWRAVYGDLVRFKEELLGRTRAHIEEVPATKKELGGVDVPFLEAEMQRLQRGLAFWKTR
ncbi:MAG: hypothetical protein M3Z28_13810 [Candidatus Dormibacteraeota bacterium]|nr:hypothetical protein [Candidatus Dormibacteraeota bacterium]